MTAHAPSNTVPSIDSADNVIASDVIGNKSDTVGGDSLVSIGKQALAASTAIDGFHDVPAQNSADNVVMSDVIGNKTDTGLGDSLYSLAHVVEEHIHSAVKVLPDRATDVQATAGAGWAYGVASASLGTPADRFDVHWVEIVADDNAQYQGQILVDGVAVTEFAFERIGVQSRSINKPVQMAVTAAGPITIKLASSTDAATASFKVEYHEY